MDYDVCAIQGFVAETFTGALEPLFPHSKGVASHARSLALRHSLNPDLMESAGWALDIGYSSPEMGIHGMDGARVLSSVPEFTYLSPYVAWHSTSEWEAETLIEYPKPDEKEFQLLWVADMTTSRTGALVSPQNRINEIADWHGQPSQAKEVTQQAFGDLNRALMLYGYKPITMPAAWV